jgi:hypothetical protein
MRRAALPVINSGVLLLSACASDTVYLTANGTAPEPKRLETDTADCRSFWPVAGGFLIGGLTGAAQGGTAGSGARDPGLVVAVMAGAGALIGLGVGVYAVASGEENRHCMRNKGYVAIEVDPQPAAGEDEDEDGATASMEAAQTAAGGRESLDDPVR